MGLCLPRRRRATSLATLPKTLSVASITNHSCVTSAGFALKVFMGDSSLLTASGWRCDDRFRFWSADAHGSLHLLRPAGAVFAEVKCEKPASVAEPPPGAGHISRRLGDAL